MKSSFKPALLAAVLASCLFSLAIPHAQAASAPATGFCPALSVNLYRGLSDSQTGGQVTQLQTFLADYYGLNPSDTVTGYFGPITQSNVIRFQTEQAISPAYGFVGPLTRAAIASVCGSTASAEGASATTPSSTPAAVTPTASAAHASAAAGLGVGFNDLFIVGNIMQQGYTGTLPPNSHAIPLSVTNGYLDSLQQNGVTTMREIVATDALADSSTYAAAGDVIKAYQTHNFTLILALGGPVGPVDAAGGGAFDCLIGPDGSNWSATANNLAGVITNFVQYLKGRSDIDQGWLASHLIIEPFNEFDSVSKNTSSGCISGWGTPQDGAVLYTAIKNAFSSAGIANEVTAPSIVGAIATSTLSSPPTGDYDQSRIWLKDYYAAGGGGRANVHIYCSASRCNLNDGASTAQTISSIFSNIISNASQTAGKPILGETGLPLILGTCTQAGQSAMSDAQRAILDADLMNNSSMTSSASMLLFWRILPFDTQDGGCSYGVVPQGFGLQTPPVYDLTGDAVLGITPQPPTATISANGQGSFDTISVPVGTAVTITATFAPGPGDALAATEILNNAAGTATFSSPPNYGSPAELARCDVPNGCSPSPLTYTFTPTQTGTYTFWPDVASENYGWNDYNPGGTTGQSVTVNVTSTTVPSCANGLNISTYPSCTCPSGQTQSGSVCVTSSVTTTAAPNPPASATASCTGGTVNFNWSASSGATNYYPRLQSSAYAGTIGTQSNCPSGWTYEAANTCGIGDNGTAVTGTSISAAAIAGASYGGWVHAGNGPGWVVQGSTLPGIDEIPAYANGINGTSFSCTSTPPPTCTNGLNISTYPSCTCPSGQTQSGSVCVTSSVTTASPCSFNGQNVASGSSVIAYQTSSVASGQTCVSQTRTCNNGTLSGSYANASCTVAAPASCSNGLDIGTYPSCGCPGGQVQTGNSCTSTSPTLGSITSPATFWGSLYTCILSRGAAASEINYWVGQTGTGITSLSSAYHSFFDSSEYMGDGTSNQTYLTQVYQCVFFRAPDSSGYTYWLSQLQTGTSRDSVLNNFLIGSEFQNNVAPALKAATGLSVVALAPQSTSNAADAVLSFVADYSNDFNQNLNAVAMAPFQLAVDSLTNLFLMLGQ